MPRNMTMDAERLPIEYCNRFFYCPREVMSSMKLQQGANHNYPNVLDDILSRDEDESTSTSGEDDATNHRSLRHRRLTSSSSSSSVDVDELREKVLKRRSVGSGQGRATRESLNRLVMSSPQTVGLQRENDGDSVAAPEGHALVNRVVECASADDCPSMLHEASQRLEPSASALILPTCRSPHPHSAVQASQVLSSLPIVITVTDFKKLQREKQELQALVDRQKQELDIAYNDMRLLRSSWEAFHSDDISADAARAMEIQFKREKHMLEQRVEELVEELEVLKKSHAEVRSVHLSFAAENKLRDLPATSDGEDCVDDEVIRCTATSGRPSVQLIMPPADNRLSPCCPPISSSCSKFAVTQTTVCQMKSAAVQCLATATKCSSVQTYDNALHCSVTRSSEALLHRGDHDTQTETVVLRDQICGPDNDFGSRRIGAKRHVGVQCRFNTPQSAAAGHNKVTRHCGTQCTPLVVDGCRCAVKKRTVACNTLATPCSATPVAVAPQLTPNCHVWDPTGLKRGTPLAVANTLLAQQLSRAADQLNSLRNGDGFQQSTARRPRRSMSSSSRLLDCIPTVTIIRHPTAISKDAKGIRDCLNDDVSVTDVEDENHSTPAVVRTGGPHAGAQVGPAVCTGGPQVRPAASAEITRSDLLELVRNVVSLCTQPPRTGDKSSESRGCSPIRVITPQRGDKPTEALAVSSGGGGVLGAFGFSRRSHYDSPLPHHNTAVPLPHPPSMALPTAASSPPSVAKHFWEDEGVTGGDVRVQESSPLPPGAEGKYKSSDRYDDETPQRRETVPPSPIKRCSSPQGEISVEASLISSMSSKEAKARHHRQPHPLESGSGLSPVLRRQLEALSSEHTKLYMEHTSLQALWSRAQAVFKESLACIQDENMKLRTALHSRRGGSQERTIEVQASSALRQTAERRPSSSPKGDGSWGKPPKAGQRRTVSPAPLKSTTPSRSTHQTSTIVQGKQPARETKPRKQ